MRDGTKISRRAVFAAPIPILATARTDNSDPPELRFRIGTPGTPHFLREDMGIVGVYDVDWLVTPEFGRMLDLFVASPGAISGVRFFGAFTAGQAEDFRPESGGTVWLHPDDPINFDLTLAALDALVSRRLTPFVVLGFFPPAVSDSPVHPPDNWDAWKQLVGAFMDVLGQRFAPDVINSWWFEVWNEPNEGRFWSGTQEDYFALYRATTEAVRESGLSIRLGGPAIAWKPESEPDFGVPWMTRFLEFIAADSTLQCDFVSFHRKGTVDDSEPDTRRLFDAAKDVRDLMAAIDPVRFAGLPIINNEADEKVGFEVPYAPRMTHVNASWLAATASIQAALTAEPSSDHRFMAAADNANLQLVQEPFDGRRSIVTYVQPDNQELVTLPAFEFYEMLWLLEGQIATVVAGLEFLFPETDLFCLSTFDDHQSSTLLTWYPDQPTDPDAIEAISLVIEGLPWTMVDVAVFWIDASHSNAWTAAGGSDSNPYPKPTIDQMPAIRQAQELTTLRPVVRGVAVDNGTWQERLHVKPFTTVLIWITPGSTDDVATRFMHGGIPAVRSDQ